MGLSTTGSGRVGPVVNLSIGVETAVVAPSATPIVDHLREGVDNLEELLMDWPDPIIGNVPEMSGTPAPEPAQTPDHEMATHA